MFKGLRAVTAVLLLLHSATALANSKHQKTEDPEAVRAIRAVLDRQVEAWNRRDLEGFMQGYWNSPDLTFYSGGSAVTGWQPTLQRYRARYQGEGNEMGSLDFRELKVEMLGPSAAFVRGRYHLKMKNSEASGLFTLTFRKLSAGWKIVHDHTSS